MTEKMTEKPNILIIGGGIAGLWTAHRLQKAGRRVLLVDAQTKPKQSLYSQGMIHGGQKFILSGEVSAFATALASLPARWDAALQGRGEIDLSAVKVTSHLQYFVARGMAEGLAAFAAAKVVNAQTSKTAPADYPGILKADQSFKGMVYTLHEKVLDPKSLINALKQQLGDACLEGDVTRLEANGTAHLADGRIISADTTIALAGEGNAGFIDALNLPIATRLRPLRQVYVADVDDPFYGHIIGLQSKPRFTVTSLQQENGRHEWYLGGLLAEKTQGWSEREIIAFAQKELQEIFPHIAWSQKTYRVFDINRAEYGAPGQDVQAGPVLKKLGSLLFGWPAKLTSAPLLADMVMAEIEKAQDDNQAQRSIA
jgi:glycine/D-amino acid oxidase-like deaminating enzyme